ncbi:hypothetical protein C0995_002781 [Termitomyces sp. Mi166|nr:hypothetical protein C0995_002781 [Termitomyces sp. Mi166\
MPLIIHPSSCCDICLEALTYNDKPPFAIPCGHIFCRSCLFGLNPSLCPLCRKPFLPERSKKLIIGEVEIPEVEGVEDKKPIELLTKLVNSLDTEGHNSTVMEVDSWLNAGNTHASLQKTREVLEEYVLLKSENSANIRLIRRLQRDMHRLQVNQSTEKENASAMEQELLSQMGGLQKAATTITFNHNPLPTPPEPFPLESLPFLAHLQQDSNLSNVTFSQRSTDRQTQNTLHLNGVPANTSVESLAAPQASPEQTTIPSGPIQTMNEHTSSHRSAIIPGASPHQRFMPGSMFEESSSSVTTNMYGQTGPPVDPFVLATDYLTEYAAGYEEGYYLSQRHLQSSNRRMTEPAAPSMMEPQSHSSAPSRQTSDGHLSQETADTSITSHSVHRPLGLRDFYSTPMSSSSSNRRNDLAPASRVSSPRPSTSSSSLPTPIHDERPWVPERLALPTMSTSPVPPELPVTSPPGPMSSHSLPLPLSVPASSSSRQSLPPLPASAPSSVASTIPSDTRSARSSRISSSSGAREQRRESDVTSAGTLGSLTREAPALIVPDSSRSRRSVFTASSSVQLSSLPGVVGSPASAYTMDSWGTVSTDSFNRVPRRPFRPIHEINSVRDLDIRGFDDFTNSDAGTVSRRSSLLSDVTQSFSSSHTEVNGNVGSHGSDSQNRTPRVASRPLPETESVASPEAISIPSVTSQDAGRHLNISNTTYSPYRDLDHNHSQHHGTTSGVSETWHRATADLTSIRSISPPHSHSISNPVFDPRSSRRHTSRPSTAVIYDDTMSSISSRWVATSLASTNALGLTDLTPSSELHISAPTPITPSRPFLRYYSENYR